jgi:hypothetical protein
MRMYSVCLCAYSQYGESSLRCLSEAGGQCNHDCTSELRWDGTMKGI